MCSYIREGGYSLFGGHDRFHNLVRITIPVLLVLHLSVVLFVVNGKWARLATYFCSPLKLLQGPGNQHSRHSVLFEIVLKWLPGSAVLGLCGAMLMLLNYFTDNLHTYSGDQLPIDPLLRATSATVARPPVVAYQYLWSFLSSIGSVFASWMVYQLIGNAKLKRAKRVHLLLCSLCVDSRSLALEAWCEQAAITGKSTHVPLIRRLVYWVLHIPCLLLASGPAYMFVMLTK